MLNIIIQTMLVAAAGVVISRLVLSPEGKKDNARSVILLLIFAMTCWIHIISIVLYFDIGHEDFPKSVWWVLFFMSFTLIEFIIIEIYNRARLEHEHDTSHSNKVLW